MFCHMLEMVINYNLSTSRSAGLADNSVLGIRRDFDSIETSGLVYELPRTLRPRAAKRLLQATFDVLNMDNCDICRNIASVRCLCLANDVLILSPILLKDWSLDNTSVG